MTIAPSHLAFPSVLKGTVTESKNYSVQARWSEKLGKHFCPVSSYFLANYHRLRPFEAARGLNSSEAMLLIHILDHKWTEKAPWPAVGTLARRMGITPRAVRMLLKSLEESKYIRRELRSNGRTTLYHLDGLQRALEKLFDEDQAAKAQPVAEAAA